MSALSLERGQRALDANNNRSGVLNVLSGLKPAAGNDSRRAIDLLFSANIQTTVTDDLQSHLVRIAERTLDRSPQSAPEYPVDSLGPLADPCEAIATGGQLDRAIVGQCLLATAALLTQSHRNVQTLDGSRSLNLYVLTTGLSGDGKSSAERIALQRVRDWQSTNAKRYRAAIEQANNTPKGERKEPPRAPYRVMGDATVEGIRRSFAEGLPSQGVFTSEAAAILTGYGMTPEHRAKTAATFNALWDSGTLSVARGTAGRVELYERRLSMHWLIQPDAVRSTLSDPALSAIGFWPRFLLATPAPSLPRTADRFQPEQHAPIRAFWARCDQLLDAAIPEDCSGLPLIIPDAEAYGIAGQFFERMEIAAKVKGGALESVRPFAVRATEQMFRVAGVLAAFQDHRDLNANDVRNAIALVSYSLDCWRNAFGNQDDDNDHERALQLFKWLAKQPGTVAREASILQLAPKPLRSRSARDAATAMLDHFGLIVREGDAWRIGQKLQGAKPWN